MNLMRAYRRRLLSRRVARLLGLLCVVACEAGGEAKVQTSSRGDDCVSCHADERARTSAPAHEEAGFGDGCASCHDELSWSPSLGFAHTAAFPLTLGHDGPACTDCHRAGFTKGATPNDCAACHAERAASVVDPVHAGLSQNCFACHRTDAFWPARFVHSWPLRGVHALTSCRSCHSDGASARYEGTSPACAGCHAEDRARAEQTFPAHASYPTACESCHGFESFAL